MAGIEPMYAEFGRRVRNERMKQELSQDDLASAIDLPRTAISNIESGRQRVLLHTLVALGKALRVNPGDLLVGLGDGIGSETEVDLAAVTTDKPLVEKDLEFIKRVVRKAQE